MLSEYEQTLLKGWEDVHRRSQLTLWLLLAVKDGPKQMSAIKEFIEERTSNTITADDKSMYRALRRLSEADMINSQKVPSTTGPDTKEFSLSDTGVRVLTTFVENNITEVLSAKQNTELFR